MPPPRSWTSPPTRRELTLLVFCLTVFILSYNLETSLRIVGVSPAKLSTSYLSTLGLGTSDPGYERDGRRPFAWRDDLEKLIVGEWEWDEGEIAGVEHPQEQLQLGGLRGSGKGSSYIYNAAGKTAQRSATRESIGVGVVKGLTVWDQFLRWKENIPETRAIAHVPGYTILDNVFMMNGTLFVVTDSPSSLPPLGSIASSSADPTRVPRPQDWQVLSKEQAQSTLGIYGGRLQGTSWLTTDNSNNQDPYTLFSLFRTHSHLVSPHAGTSFTSTSGLHIISPGGWEDIQSIPPPVRMMFPSIPTFSSPGLPSASGDEKDHPPLRVKAYNGLHPQLLKAVFPIMGISYAEDWKDLAEMHVPFLFDRIVIADSGAAERGREQWTLGWVPPPKKTVEVGSSKELRKRLPEPDMGHTLEKRADEDQEGKPVWAAPFVGLKAPDTWWTPVRNALLSYLRLPLDSPADDNSKEKSKKAKRAVKPVLTYISMQSQPAGAGPRLKNEDHATLLQGLSKLQNEGVLGEVHVVRGNGSTEVWEKRMKAVAQSSIILGTFGPHMADSVFMPAPLPASTSSTYADGQSVEAVPPVLMEFFPPRMFRRDQEYAVRSLGMRYIAWWNERKFAGNSLPPVMGLTGTRVANLDDWQIAIDTNAVVQTIREEAARLKGVAS